MTDAGRGADGTVLRAVYLFHVLLWFKRTMIPREGLRLDCNGTLLVCWIGGGGGKKGIFSHRLRHHYYCAPLVLHFFLFYFILEGWGRTGCRDFGFSFLRLIPCHHLPFSLCYVPMMWYLPFCLFL